MGLLTSLITGRREKLDSFLNGFSDCHCHILPGVDDGFKKVEDSLAVLSLFEKAGIKKVWFTPHIMEDMPNTVNDLCLCFESFRAAYAGCDGCTGDIELCLASENMLDNLFRKRLADNELLPLSGNRLLVETSYLSAPLGFDEMVNDIIGAGYTPLLAHPERYSYMAYEEYDRLHEVGVEFQLSLPSLLGYYGAEEKRRAEVLLSLGYYSAIGTDLHRISTFKEICDSSLKRTYLDMMKKIDNNI